MLLFCPLFIHRVFCVCSRRGRRSTSCQRTTLREDSRRQRRAGCLLRKDRLRQRRAGRLLRARAFEVTTSFRHRRQLVHGLPHHTLNEHWLVFIHRTMV